MNEGHIEMAQQQNNESTNCERLSIGEKESESATNNLPRPATVVVGGNNVCMTNEEVSTLVQQ